MIRFLRRDILWVYSWGKSYWAQRKIWPRHSKYSALINTLIWCVLAPFYHRSHWLWTCSFYRAPLGRIMLSTGVRHCGFSSLYSSIIRLHLIFMFQEFLTFMEYDGTLSSSSKNVSFFFLLSKLSCLPFQRNLNWFLLFLSLHLLLLFFLK